MKEKNHLFSATGIPSLFLIFGVLMLVILSLLGYGTSRQSVAVFIFEEFTLFVFPAHPRTIRISTTSSRTPPAAMQICWIFFWRWR